MAAPDTFSIEVGDLDRILTSWTLAIVSEGYTRSQLDKGDFKRDAREVVDELLRTPPFSDPALQRLMIVAAVSVESERPGSDIKLVNPVPATSTFRTAFGAMFGRDFDQGKQIERILHGDSQLVIERVQRFPELATVENFLVIVNNTSTDGGAAHDGVGWFSKARDGWPKVAIHELGHQAFSLADEYPYHNTRKDPARPVAGNPPAEPVEPNVTLETSIGTIKWAGLVTLPQSLVPGTVASATCVRDKPLKPTDPEIPLNAVGAFEGARYHDCGIFRPSRACKMRESKDPFCPVCENVIRMKLGRYMLGKVNTERRQLVGAWTSVLPFAAKFAPSTLFYNSVLGNYALSENFRFLMIERRPDGTPVLVPNRPDIGVGNLNPGWSTLVPFVLGGIQHVLGHDFGAGRLSMWRLGGQGDTLVQTFVDTPGGTESHLVAVVLGGAPHLVRYNTFTGDATLARIASNDAAPITIASANLGAGHTAVTALRVDEEPFVLTFRGLSGEVMLHRVTPTGFVRTFRSRPFFWPTNVTHVASTPKEGLPYVTRYAATTGRMLIDHVRTSGTGIDFVCRVDPSPGPGAVSFFGFGAQAMGSFRFRDPGGTDPFEIISPGGSVLIEDIYLYRGITHDFVHVNL